MAKKMTPEARAKLQARVQKIVDKDGLMKTAQKIPLTSSTLRRFLGGQPMHEASLRLIESSLST